MSLELDRLDHLGAQAFEGFVVRKDLVRQYAKSYPVPAYVVEFLLGRYCPVLCMTGDFPGWRPWLKQLESRRIRLLRPILCALSRPPRPP
jgi:ATP-dependent Lon protease